MPNRIVDRRMFLSTGVAFTASALTSPLAADKNDDAEIITVTGPVKSKALGTMLPHEHVLVDFVGADKVSPDRYDRDEAFVRFRL